MENRINIAELLKDCPKGMELDCTTWENVTFEGVNNNGIYIKRNNKPLFDNIVILNQYGCVTTLEDEKCRIFPKGKTTWQGFVPPCRFKDGDILFVDCSDDEEEKGLQYVFINKPKAHGKWHSYCYLDGIGYFRPKETYLTDTEYHPRLAAEEEEQQLFKAIKDNGYKWNPETKTLEKLILPKFKVGDKIKKGEKIATIVRIYKSFYDVIFDSRIGSFTIDLQDEWELVQDKFDINTLKSFESKVLVRDYNNDPWRIAFWGCLIDNRYKFNYDTTRGYYKQCIPYESNEHLLGTTNACDEFYKTWE